MPGEAVAFNAPETGSRLSAAAMLGRIHELELRQAELELENENLKQAEDQVNSLLQRSQTLIHTASDGIHVLDENGNVTEANLSFSRMLGYTREELMTLNVADWDAQWSGGELMAVIEDLIACPRLFETRHRHKDGSLHDVEINAAGIRMHGRNFLYAAARDVSDRKRAQVALEESELRYRTLFETSPAGIMVIDENGVILDANAAISQTMLYTHDELIGSNIQRFILPGMVQQANENIHRIFAGETLEDEVVNLRKDGTYCTFILKESSFTMPDGKKAILAISNDISERKKAEIALRNSEANLLAMFNATDESIFLLGTDETLLGLNDVAAKRMGYSRQAIIGYKIQELLPPAVILSRQPYIDRAMSTGRHVVFEDERNGRWMVNHLHPILGTGGAVTGLAVYSRDITYRKDTENALRESEEHYRFLADNATDVIWVQDLGTWAFRYISPSVEQMLGYPAGEVILNGLDKIITAGSLQYLNSLIPARIERFHQGIREVYTDEVEHLHKNGCIVWAEVITRLFVNAITGRVEAAGVSRDITSRRQAENEIRDLNSSLEQRVSERTRELETINRDLAFHLKEIEQFTFIASHDLQEPLLTLINCASLIQEEYAGKLDEDGNMSIDYITRAATRMRSLVKGLLDYALLGKEGVMSMVDCNKIVTEVLRDMAYLIAVHHAVVTIQELPTLYGFAAEVRLLFQNLIANAIKFQQKDSKPEITISAESREKDYVFKVADNGIGIREKDRENIFILFRRMHNRNEYGGTGIGLAHCKKIIELHGGRIWVESAPGTGSVFLFTIPKEMNA